MSRKITTMRSLTATVLLGASLSATPTLAAENLLSLYRSVADSDPEVQRIRASRMASVEAKGSGRKLFEPYIAIRGDVARKRQRVRRDQVINSRTRESSYGEAGVELYLTMPLYDPSIKTANQSQEARAVWAQAAATEAEQDLQWRLAERYMRVSEMRSQLALAQRETQQLQGHVNRASARVAAEVDPAIELSDVQSRYDLAVTRELAAKNQLDRAEQWLLEVTGGNHVDIELISSQLNYVAPSPADIEQWLSSAMQNNSKLQTAKSDLQVAEGDVERVKSGYYPTVELFASESYRDNVGAVIFGREKEETAVGLQFELPLYQGNVIGSRLNQHQQLQLAAEHRMESVRRRVARDTRAAYQGVSNAMARAVALGQAIASTERALAGAKSGRDLGKRTTITMLNWQRSLFKAKAEQVEVAHDYLRHSLALKYASGTLSEEDLAWASGFAGQSREQVLLQALPPLNTALPAPAPAPAMAPATDLSSERSLSAPLPPITSAPAEAVAMALKPAVMAPATSLLPASGFASSSGDPAWLQWPASVQLGNQAHRLADLVFSPDGRMAISLDAEGSASLWQLDNAALLAKLPVAVVSTVAFSPDGDQLALGSVDGSVTLWSVPRQASGGRFVAHQGLVTQVRYSADGNFLLSTGQDGAVRIQRASDGRLLQAFEPGLGALYSAELNSDQGWLAIGTADGQVQLISLADGAARPLGRMNSGVVSLRFDASGQQLLALASLSGQISNWLLVSGEQQALVSAAPGVAAAEFYGDAGQFATLARSGQVGFWNASTGESLQ